MPPRALHFPKTPSLRDQVAACVDSALGEVIGDEPWRVLKRQLAALHGLVPEDMVYDQERFTESVGLLLGEHPVLILYPFVLERLRAAFPLPLGGAESIHEVPALIDAVDPSLQVEDAVTEGMKQGEHALVLCRNLDMKAQIVKWFLRAASRTGEMSVLISGNPFGSGSVGRDDLLSAPGPASIDTFRLTVKEVFFAEHEFNLQKAIGNLQGLAEESTRKGFRGIRLALDMEDLLKYGEDEAVRGLEAAIGAKLPLSSKLLCTYDSRQFRGKEGLRDSLVSCHSFVILPEGYELEGLVQGGETSRPTDHGEGPSGGSSAAPTPPGSKA
jgi:hypothetical protein